MRSVGASPSVIAVPAGARPPSISPSDAVSWSATWLCPTSTSGVPAMARVAARGLVGEHVLPDGVARAAVVERDAVRVSLRLEAVEERVLTPA